MMCRLLCGLILLGGIPVLCTAEDGDLVFLENDALRVGVRKSSGGAIAWISRAGAKQNLVNSFDRGRLIQQSYYGEKDGSLWDKQPWRWNPVQGGDWRGTGAKVLELKQTKDSLRVVTLPKHWATGKELQESRMEQTLRLAGPLLHIHFKFTYSGEQRHPLADQEIPAIFLEPEYDQLVAYSGKRPFEGDAVTKSKPGWPNEYKEMTESWAAYVNKDGFGLGAYVPEAKKLTCYRFGDGDRAKGACSYFAPLKRFAIESGFNFEYTVAITVGTAEEIRQRFVELRTRQVLGN